MGLRSRKPGGAARKAEREDFEQQAMARADAPLQQIHMQTEAFNLLWRGFLFKVACALIALALYAAWVHRDKAEHVLVDVVSMAFYAAAAAWLRSLENSEAKYFSNRLFRLAFGLMVSQVGVVAFHTYELGHISMEKEFFPSSVIYMFVAVGSLEMMRRNARTIASSRKELGKSAE
mmetsp:Transcript_5768/g.14774  ORF Transcript_5768/g.14774 Transcript_5768/m.14774 type:complete len:176 (+) Transcript_5768:90-617(+)